MLDNQQQQEQPTQALDNPVTGDVEEAKVNLTDPFLVKSGPALPLKCKRRCCGRMMWMIRIGRIPKPGVIVQPPAQELEEPLLPLKKVAIKSVLQGAVAMSDIELTYVNPSETETFECSYEFPLEKSTVLAKLVASLDGRTVEAKVKEEEEAKERYEDAIAAGNAAVLAQRDSVKQESMSIKLGNLKPQQEAKLSLQLVTHLKVLQGSYMFDLPVAFFPDYSKHGAKKGSFVYDFSYQVRLQTANKVTQLSLPQHSEIVEQNEAGTDLLIRSARAARQINLYYRTKDMMAPRLVYAENPQTKEVACMASFVPTFEPPNPQEMMEVVEDEEPEQESLAHGQDFHFIFLVDRSGSMREQGRMEAAKEALKLFVRSLPTGCSFTIYSFGSRYSHFTMPGQMGGVIEYKEECIEAVMSHIEEMSADHGGTNIITPLRAVKEWNKGPDKKRVFILTDGMVIDPDAVVQEASVDNERVRVFTFGLGAGCDVSLVQRTATAGRGSCSLVKDGGGDLNGQVIRALQSAMEPSLRGCGVLWNAGPLKQLNEVFRGQSVISTTIMPKAHFDEGLLFAFSSQEDPRTNQAIKLEFTKLDFSPVTGEAADALFKLAAQELMLNASLSKEAKIAASIKYQTLCDETALIGVIKQTEKATGEVKEFDVKFGKKQQAQPQVRGITPRMKATKGAPMMRARGAASNSISMASAMPSSARIRRGMPVASESQKTLKKCAAPTIEMMNLRSAAAPRMLNKSRATASKAVIESAAQIEAESAIQTSLMDQCEDQAMISIIDRTQTKRKKKSKKVMQEKKKSVPMNQDALASSLAQSSVRASAFNKESKQKLARSPPKAATALAVPKVAAQATGAASTSFDQVIGYQHISGYWPPTATPTLSKLLEAGQTEQGEVLAALSSLALVGTDEQTAYTTLLAIYILNEAFDERESEWTLLVRKAKAFLKAAGVDKPEKLLKLFSLDVVPGN